MKKLTIGLGAVLSTALLGTMSLAADKVLTVASWAAPFHTMNENVFPWMSSQLKSCTSGSLSLKVLFIYIRKNVALKVEVIQHFQQIIQLENLMKNQKLKSLTSLW